MPGQQGVRSVRGRVREGERARELEGKGRAPWGFSPSVLTVKMRHRIEGDEELGAVRVAPAVGHGEHALGLVLPARP